ncbi:porin family protein [Flagellimonas sp. GZD32]|uniref:porin family protein n=1 Tax=Flagellimonas cixiensis TaxID=3228750 RepID=UPI0035C91548
MVFSVKAQLEQDSIVLDNKYLEDQFYFGIGYNILANRPDDVVQRNLSYNLQAGFIKDIPFNKRRNFGIGLGFGYAVNSYYSNVVATEDNNEVIYQIMDQSMYNRSKFELHSLEVPFELRWRTSTAEDYKFWRIYAGVKFGYVFSGTSKVVTDEGTYKFSNGDIEDLQYGLTFNFGYNTWNVHTYYGLNPLLKEGTLLDSGSAFDFHVLRVGLIFYIL